MSYILSSITLTKAFDGTDDKDIDDYTCAVAMSTVDHLKRINWENASYGTLRADARLATAMDRGPP